MSGLELREVLKHYRGSEVVRAVDGVSLRVAPGELVALYGPSGSGKTTLLLLAAGIERPDAGEVRFDDRPLSGLSPPELALHQRRHVGFVTQDPHLLAGVPAVENAALKLLADRVSLREARRRAGTWLERVGLGDRLDHDPAHLSGGERQRVAIARALVNEPSLVLADEPTGNLDSRRGAEILELLANVCRRDGAGALLVTHDPQAADVADRVLVLRDGHAGGARRRRRRGAGREVARRTGAERRAVRPGALLYLYGRRLRTHPIQELLAAIGIAVGVALVFAVIVANASIGGSVAQLVDGIGGAAQMQVAARSSQGIDERLLHDVRRLPGVAHATPVLEQRAQLSGRRGRTSILLVGVDPSLARARRRAHARRRPDARHHVPAGPAAAERRRPPTRRERRTAACGATPDGARSRSACAAPPTRRALSPSSAPS